MPPKKKGAKKKPARKKAARPRRRSTAPVSTKPESPPPAETPPERKVGERVASVRSRRERFNRAGLRFSAHLPVIVREDEIGTERFERILAEPWLRVEMQ